MRRRALALLLAVAAAAVLIACGGGGGGDSVPVETAAASGGEEAVAIQATLSLIDSNGPFPHRADGEVFENREGLLPDEPRGYYHAYTVETPGSGDRGARRLVTGEDGEVYYTRDHYSSFELIGSGKGKGSGKP